MRITVESWRGDVIVTRDIPSKHLPAFGANGILEFQQQFSACREGSLMINRLEVDHLVFRANSEFAWWPDSGHFDNLINSALAYFERLQQLHQPA